MANDAGENQVMQAQVIESTTLLACPSHNQKKKAKNKGVVAKIPVVIAEPKIQINVESTITLENPALEIKRIKKSLFLTQCELIPTDEKKSGKLFISGFVTKNIEYATAAVITSGVVSGDIRHTTVNIPFSCFAKIDFDEEPEFEGNKNIIEVEIISPNNMGSDPSEQNFIQAQRFNERVFCELLEASFREKDIRLNPTVANPAFPNVLVSNTFLEKMVIDITLKILQTQQVEIPRVEKKDKDDKDDKDEKDEKDCKDRKDEKDGKEGKDGKDRKDEKDGKDGNYRNRISGYDWPEESGICRLNW